MQRKHQAEFENIIDGIENGSGVKVIDVIATPGSGKSSINVQATRLIKAGLADAILGVVPRSALQYQAETVFIDPFFRKMFNHNYLIRSSTNDPNPCRGTNGFVTTYQAIVSDKENTVLREICSKRYIIVLDEFHHIEDCGIWHQAIDQIVKKCHFVIKMTGTLGRGDKKEIAYIEYYNNKPYFQNSGQSRMILYNRIDALKENAILPIEFHLSDGEFEWKRENGSIAGASSFSKVKTPKLRGEALFTALNSDFAEELLFRSIKHWKGIKEQNSNSKLLIVTHSYTQAKEILSLIKKSVGVIAEIATSHESPSAHRSIKRFKKGQCDCLVTIAMAYEGLDVPGITHICVLTNIRSREWIEQMLARGVRIDKDCGLPYEMQKCYVFAPMDVKFKKVVNMIKKQQLAAVEYFSTVKVDREDENNDDDIDDELEQMERPGIVPIFSKLTGNDSFELGLQDQKTEIIKTIKEQETEIRQQIKYHVNKYARKKGFHPYDINKEIKVKFNKARKLMTLPELRNCFDYIKKIYPVDYPERIKNSFFSDKIEKFVPKKQKFKQLYFDNFDINRESFYN